MEAGVAFFLLFLLLVVVGGAGLFLWAGETDSEAGGEEARPQHVQTGQPTEARIFPSLDGTGEHDKARGET